MKTASHDSIWTDNQYDSPPAMLQHIPSMRSLNCISDDFGSKKAIRPSRISRQFSENFEVPTRISSPTDHSSSSKNPRDLLKSKMKSFKLTREHVSAHFNNLEDELAVDPNMSPQNINYSSPPLSLFAHDETSSSSIHHDYHSSHRVLLPSKIDVNYPPDHRLGNIINRSHNDSDHDYSNNSSNASTFVHTLDTIPSTGNSTQTTPKVSNHLPNTSSSSLQSTSSNKMNVVELDSIIDLTKVRSMSEGISESMNENVTVDIRQTRGMILSPTREMLLRRNSSKNNNNNFGTSSPSSNINYPNHHTNSNPALLTVSPGGGGGGAIIHPTPPHDMILSRSSSFTNSNTNNNNNNNNNNNTPSNHSHHHGYGEFTKQSSIKSTLFPDISPRPYSRGGNNNSNTNTNNSTNQHNYSSSNNNSSHYNTTTTTTTPTSNNNNGGGFYSEYNNNKPGTPGGKVGNSNNSNNHNSNGGNRLVLPKI
jgi:hypothetical protein